MDTCEKTVIEFDAGNSMENKLLAIKIKEYYKHPLIKCNVLSDTKLEFVGVLPADDTFGAFCFANGDLYKDKSVLQYIKKMLHYDDSLSDEYEDVIDVFKREDEKFERKKMQKGFKF